MISEIFFATSFWFIVLTVAAIPLVLGPLSIRKRHRVARGCQILIACSWCAGMLGAIGAGFSFLVTGTTAMPLYTPFLLRLCQGLPLMSLAVIGLAPMVFYTYAYPREDARVMTRADKAA
jgi:hypothetical protein